MAFTYEDIILGNAPNDGLGDPLRDGGVKINNNLAKIKKVLNNVEAGVLQIKKHPNNNDPQMVNVIEPNDAISGWWDTTTLIDAWIYQAGNIGDRGSYLELGGWDEIPLV